VEKVKGKALFLRNIVPEKGDCFQLNQVCVNGLLSLSSLHATQIVVQIFRTELSLTNNSE